MKTTKTTIIRVTNWKARFMVMLVEHGSLDLELVPGLRRGREGFRRLGKGRARDAYYELVRLDAIQFGTNPIRRGVEFNSVVTKALEAYFDGSES